MKWMMEKQVVMLFEAAKKAADAAMDGSQAEESRCTDALTQLKNLPITYQLLLSTQVGKSLGVLKKHPNKKIRLLTNRVIKTWKNKVLELEDDSSETKPGEEVKKSTKPVAVVVCMKQKQGSCCLPKCNDALRDKVLEGVYEGLCKVTGEAQEDEMDEVNACDPIGVAVSVESALFRKWGSNEEKKRMKYISLIFNIKDPNNPDFRRKVLLGHIKAEEIGEMSTEEMASDRRKMENQEIIAKRLKMSESEDKQEATCDQFKCGRCGQRKTKYYLLQTRSADEPMTVYVTCQNCNKRWKFSN